MPSLLALVLLLFSLRTAGAEPVYLPTFACVGGPQGMKLPADARQLSTLGKLQRHARAEDEPGTYRELLVFDGLTLNLIRFSAEPARMLLVSADISHPRWNRLLPFALGQPLAQARATLGPAAQTDTGLTHAYGSEAGALRLVSAGGVLTRLSYSCYTG
ncbi:hypothetical protein [Massilia sp. TS11]|uniref:hypothetical protein n=1 Tax=Massilia sp. TS11 TaxID=2908003 RepID=UPI001EDA8DC8|nr:hypothetical protein [Massilia sp. TS11]MCG2586159.1 hypothetical protein [Massilia sp. TS11]